MLSFDIYVSTSTLTWNTSVISSGKKNSVRMTGPVVPASGGVVVVNLGSHPCARENKAGEAPHRLERTRDESELSCGRAAAAVACGDVSRPGLVRGPPTEPAAFAATTRTVRPHRTAPISFRRPLTTAGSTWTGPISPTSRSPRVVGLVVFLDSK